MSAAGDLQITRITQVRTTHTIDGPKTAELSFTRVTVRTPNGPLQVDVEDGDFGRALAKPGSSVPVELSVPGVVTRAG